jgi:predicted SAM-dependent methyltransferase
MTTESELLEFLDAYENRRVPATGLSKLVGQVIPSGFRHGARVIATRAISPVQRRKAAALVDGRPTRLNVGCGSSTLEGWINIDLVGLPVDLAWDIAGSLPFADGTVDAVFHEHVIEHMSGAAGYRFLKDCHRVLRPGGVMRVVAPDASRYMKSYFDPDHEFMTSFRGERPTPMLALQEEFYSFGHQAVYDPETIEFFCRTIGFDRIEERTFGESRIDPCPDSEHRVPDSFYVEAVK